MKKISTLALGIALSLGLVACSSEPKTEVAAVSGIELQNFDTSVRHQDDFYYSVNGKWLANTPFLRISQITVHFLYFMIKAKMH
ncbi:peptidase M13 [Shewanella putrefaciens]|nr:peptidase M13 [Shewanella putrefaciens]